MKYITVSFTGLTYTKTPVPGTTVDLLVPVTRAESGTAYVPRTSDTQYYKTTFTPDQYISFHHNEFNSVPKSFYAGWAIALNVDPESNYSELDVYIPSRLNTSDPDPDDRILQPEAIFHGESTYSGIITLANAGTVGGGSALVTLHDDSDNDANVLGFGSGRGWLYDPTAVWGWDGINWRWIYPTETESAALVAAGGGRYHQSVVAVSHGSVYYGSIT
jgi:hypothetical protein